MRQADTPRDPDSRKARFKAGMAQADAAKETRVGDALDSLHVVPINGRPFTFSKLTFGDLRAIEEHFGSIPDFFEGISGDSTTAYLLIVWLQLRKTDPSLELDDTLGFVMRNKISLAELTSKAIECSGLFDPSEPDPNEDGADAEAAEARSTGEELSDNSEP